MWQERSSFRIGKARGISGCACLSSFLPLFPLSFPLFPLHLLSLSLYMPFSLSHYIPLSIFPSTIFPGAIVAVVLDFIVERKRMDDLASSIVDGRFREQKHRMKQSGLANAVYLIEEYGHKHLGNMPEASLRQVKCRRILMRVRA